MLYIGINGWIMIVWYTTGLISLSICPQTTFSFTDRKSMITGRFYSVVQSLCAFGLYKVQYKNHTVHYSQSKHMTSYIRIFISVWCMCISDRVSWLNTFDESFKPLSVRGFKNYIERLKDLDHKMHWNEINLIKGLYKWTTFDWHGRENLWIKSLCLFSLHTKSILVAS